MKHFPSQILFTTATLILIVVTMLNVALTIFSSQPILAAAFQAFPTHTNPNGLTFSDVSLQVGLGVSVPLRATSLIDWHNSKSIDIVGIREDNPSCIEVRLWSSASNSFSATEYLTEGCQAHKKQDNPVPSSLYERVYVSAAAVDINRDGLLDLVATHNSITGGGVDIIFQLSSPTAANPSGLLLQQNVINFPNTYATGNSSNLLNGSSVNIVNYFGDCGLHDIVAVNDKNKAIVFRNQYAIVHGPRGNAHESDEGGKACVNPAKWIAGNASFLPEMATLVDDVIPAGTASVDLDGDCGGEYLVARSNWTMNLTQVLRFPLAQNIPSATNSQQPHQQSQQQQAGATVTDAQILLSVPNDFGAPSWSDWDGDGAIDVAFAVCVEKTTTTTTTGSGSGTTSTTTVLNLVRCQTPNNYSGVLVLLNIHGSPCEGLDCCAKFDSRFDSILHQNIAQSALPSSARLISIFDSVTSLGGGSNTNRNASSLSSSSSSSSSQSKSQQQEKNANCFLSSADPIMMPVKIRPGDLNDDMYADAVVSSTCGPLYLEQINGGLSSMSFTATRFITSSTTSVQGENSAIDLDLLSSEHALPFFFDLTDDGRLDVLVLRQLNYSDPACAPSVIINNNNNRSACVASSGAGLFAFYHSEIQEQTNYFITVTIINGAVNLPNAAWGAIQVGATARFQHLDINNDVHTSAGTQIPSTAYFELAMPRPHYGVGLTFASIMNFAAGFVVNGGAVSNKWPNVYLTPNSQVVCVPYPITEPSQWVLRLYLLGNWDLQLVLIAWGIALAVIGIPIVMLGIREVREDRRSSGF